MGLMPEMFGPLIEVDGLCVDTAPLVGNENPNHDAEGRFATSKYTGAKVGKAEHVRADEIEKSVAHGIGGQWAEDHEFYDVKTADERHFLEVKSRLNGSGNTISVHPDALMRKVDGMRGKAGVFHTVVVDDRDTYEGGAHADKYSGHRLYYKRGCDRYSLSEMHPVKDYAELKRLLDMPYRALPAKAKGSLPKGAEAKELRDAAERAHASRLAKDRDRKQRLKEKS